MKYIDLYESEFLTDKEEITDYMENLFVNFDVDKLTIESDGLIYDGNLAFTGYGNVTKLEIKIKSVTGYFECRDSNLINLEECPKIVGEYFDCSGTSITSLKYCPVSVGSIFFCYDMKITDPREYRFALYSEIGGEFRSTYNEIDKIINNYSGAINKKHWPYAINCLSRVKL